MIENKNMFKLLRKAFTQTKMGWPKVIIISVLCGIIPGLLMIPESLTGTSFKQPGISFEFWILMAMFIILNCDKPLEAGLKTFVFFLISQPLIYLVQVPFYSRGWEIFSFYPRWGYITLMTFPGAMIAWFSKKDKWISVPILSVAYMVLAYEFPTILNSMINRFPRCIIAVGLIMFEVVMFAEILFKDKKKKLAACAIAILLFAASLGYFYITNRNDNLTYVIDLEGDGPFEVISEMNDVEFSIAENRLTVMTEYMNSFPIDIKDGNGNIITIYFIYNSDGVEWSYEE